LTELALRWLRQRSREARYQRLTAAARGVLTDLALLAREDGRIAIGERSLSVKEIAEEWGLNVKTVESNMAKLVKAGLLVETGSLFALADFSPENLKPSRCRARTYGDQPEIPPTPPIMSSTTSLISQSFEGKKNSFSRSIKDRDWNPLED